MVRTFTPSLYRTDKLLGWSLKPNLSLRKKISSFKGRNYDAHYKTDSNGFRTASKKEESDSKESKENAVIFATGDSFTADLTSSNNDSWFGVLSKELDAPSKIYAYGISGSGTTQQMLAFKKFKDTIKPHTLIIQFCTNDPWNDSIDYSKYSIVRNQDWRRPYLKDGNIVYNSGNIHKLYRFLHSHSRLFQMADIVLQILQYRSLGSYHNLSSLNQKQRQELINHSLEDWSKAYREYIALANASGVKEFGQLAAGREMKLQRVDF